MDDGIGGFVDDGRVPLMMHYPVVITDGGPWATHDQSCAVCRKNKAILELGVGAFHPCGECQTLGWDLIRRTTRLGKWLGRFRNI